MSHPMNLSEELDELFDEYYPVGTVVANADIDDDKALLMTQILAHRRDKFKAKLSELFTRGQVEARISENDIYLQSAKGAGSPDDTIRLKSIIKVTTLRIEALKASLEEGVK